MKTGIIKSVEYVKTSIYGNAQYRALVLTEDNSIEAIYAGANSSYNIEMRNLNGCRIKYETKVKYNKITFTSLSKA
jgi:hypothetical protein